MVHLVLLAAVAAAALLPRGRRISLGLGFGILFLFAALRYDYGNDYNNYHIHYLQIQAGDFSAYESEPLFTALNQAVPHFYLLIALTSLLFLAGVWAFLCMALPEERRWMGLAIFVGNPYLFLMNLSAIRQSLAMVAFLGAVELGIRRKFLAYCLAIALAALLHKSAWLLLALYPVLSDRPVKPWECGAVCLVLAGVLLAVDLRQLLLWVAWLFRDGNYVHYVASSGSNSLRATLLTGVFFLYTLYNLPRLEGRSLVYAKLYLLSTLLGILAYRLSVFTRMQMYFEIFALAALPAIASRNRALGPVWAEPDQPVTALVECGNRFVLPYLMGVIMMLDYYSFFTTARWEPFWQYQSILGRF